MVGGTCDSNSKNSPRMKRVVIDARLSSLEHAGIGRYAQMLIEHLGRLPTTDSRLQTINPSIRHYTLREQLEMPKILDQEHPDLVHFPHFNVPLLYNKLFVVTIHDLLWHDQVGMNVTTLPPWLYGLKYFGYRLVLRHAVIASKAIIVPSEWVSKKIIERFPSVKEKIFVVYEGVSEAFKGLALQTQGQALLDKYGLKPNHYLIYTGSLYPHKNVSLVLDVLPKFPDLKLVVACARSVFWERFEKEVRSRQLGNQIVLAGFVPDEELATLYRNALAFVFPSLSEGFGLPGLEAMAVGCPVISSNAGALPEIYAGAAEYFDPKSGRDLRREIERMQKEKGLREELVKKGLERASQFSWDKCAKETLEIYNRVLQ